MFRELEPLLEKAPFDTSRVIWSSSLEASPKFYDREDWQLIKTRHSYESAKYQVDLIATYLDWQACMSPETKHIRHFVSEPGVCSTMISSALVGPVMNSDHVILCSCFIILCVASTDFRYVGSLVRFFTP